MPLTSSRRRIEKESNNTTMITTTIVSVFISMGGNTKKKERVMDERKKEKRTREREREKRLFEAIVKAHGPHFRFGLFGQRREMLLEEKKAPTKWTYRKPSYYLNRQKKMAWKRTKSRSRQWDSKLPE